MTPEEKEEVLYRQLGILCDAIIAALVIADTTKDPKNGIEYLESFISEIDELRELKKQRIEPLKNG